MRISLAKVRKNGWKLSHAASIVALLAAAVWLTRDSWRDIIRIAFRDEESSHILLVPIVVIWLIWVRRGRLRHCRQRGVWIGPAITAVGAVLYWVGDEKLIEVFWHAGAVLVAVGCCLTILGIQIFRSFLPAVLALVFLVPLPGRIRQAIAIPLENTTARATAQVCELVGVDAQLSGNLLRINHVDVAVGEACNGMRMTLALILVSYTFAFTTPIRGYVRFLIIAISPMSAILCNVIRLVPTVWVYGNFSENSAEIFHAVSGWVMLVVSFILLMAIIRLLQWAFIPVTTFTLARD
jgi:exosortase